MIKTVKYNIAPIIQPAGSDICGPTSLYVAAKYFGVDVGEYQLFVDSFAYENYGTYLPQIGAKALALGLTAEIIMFNPHLFSVADIGQTNPVAALQNAKTRWADNEKRQNGLTWFDKFHNAGGGNAC